MIPDWLDDAVEKAKWARDTKEPAQRYAALSDYRKHLSAIRFLALVERMRELEGGAEA
jgi:hypothetical protein